jgi:hypothetical protein
VDVEVGVGVGVNVGAGVGVRLGVDWQKAGRDKPRVASTHEMKILREIALRLVNASPKECRNHAFSQTGARLYSKCAHVATRSTPCSPLTDKWLNQGTGLPPEIAG